MRSSLSHTVAWSPSTRVFAIRAPPTMIFLAKVHRPSAQSCPQWEAGPIGTHFCIRIHPSIHFIRSAGGLRRHIESAFPWAAKLALSLSKFYLFQEARPGALPLPCLASLVFCLALRVPPDSSQYSQALDAHGKKGSTEEQHRRPARSTNCAGRTVAGAEERKNESAAGFLSHRELLHCSSSPQCALLLRPLRPRLVSHRFRRTLFSFSVFCFFSRTQFSFFF